jgi:glycosyltransferase involved in cell wall biosynthesis
MPASPVFSVTTPVYNGDPFIHRTYATLRAQTFTDWEWVVVDDGSTDGTADRIRAIAALDPRVRLVSYPKNRGRQHARTVSLQEARGDWIVVWDVDDMYYPDRLAVAAEARARGYEFFCSYAVLVDNDLRIKGVRGPVPGVLTDRIFVHPSLACRADLLRSIGYDSGPGHSGIIGEDVPVVIRLSGEHHGLWADDALAIYQEDREVRLDKTLDYYRSWVQYLRRTLRERRGTIGPLRRMRIRLPVELRFVVLNLMRVYPDAYLWTVPLRASGGTVPGWNLSPDRREFVERLAGTDFDVPAAALPELAERLVRGLDFPGPRLLEETPA